MRTGWLAAAAGYKVEHVPCPRPGQPGDLAHPPLGLLHTTEGPTIEGALAVFRQHYAPHFTVGVDSAKRGRILQHVPLGEMAAALENRPGGVETNRECRVQIEIVGFSQKTIWLPGEPTLDLLARLLSELELAAGIPLAHPSVGRNAAKWATASGWVGHIDAPENAHWDPGKLNYPALFRRVAAFDEVASATVKTRPRLALPVGKTAGLKRASKDTPPHPAHASPETAPPARKRRKPAAPQLRAGATGPWVRTLQKLLAKQGAKIVVDGDFGPSTANSVRAFQRRSGLEVDGVVGAKTWRALNR